MKTLRVVSYIRMSSDRQEDSPERQRAAVTAYAKSRGYALGAEYADMGISGWKDDRPQFKKLLVDAAAKKFDVILVDDSSRLSRQDPIANIATVVHPLRQAGVKLETAKDGPTNWDDLGGQILTMVKASQDNESVKDMSYRVLGGMVKKAQAGMWMGAAPFGYKVHRVTDPDRPDKVVDRFLVPGDPSHVEAVKWIFNEYASHRRGKAALATELAKRGIFSPRKGKNGKPKPFTTQAIRGILTNRAYLGEYRWNAKSEGKFHRFKDGHAEKKSAKKVQQNDQTDWIVLPQRHESLIDPDTFQAVQGRLNGNSAPSTPHADGGGFKLSKLMTCGKCGEWMYGFTEKLRDRTESRYRCGAYNQGGKAKCDCNTVKETTIVRVIGAKLQRFFTDPDVLAELRAVVRQQETDRQDPDTRDDLQRRLAKLEAEVVAGEDRVLKLPDDMVSGAVNALRRVKAERDAVSAELAKLEAQKGPLEDFEKAVSGITANFWRLADLLEHGAPMDVRAALGTLIDRVELHFNTRTTAKTTRTTHVGGVIHLKLPEGSDVTSSANRICSKMKTKCSHR